MWGKNKEQEDSCEQLAYSESTGGDHEETKPVRRSANELYELGQTARADLTEKLLDGVYRKLNEQSESGQVETTISFNYVEYKPIIQNVLDKLNEQGYIVDGELKDAEVTYALGIPAYQSYDLAISWDKQTENKDAKS